MIASVTAEAMFDLNPYSLQIVFPVYAKSAKSCNKGCSEQQVVCAIFTKDIYPEQFAKEKLLGMTICKV